jgi:hypothetical protein
MPWPNRLYTFNVVKRHKRLHIVSAETDEIVYTPPDFVQVIDRHDMHFLAKCFTTLQSRDIELIAAFETRFKKNVK